MEADNLLTDFFDKNPNYEGDIKNFYSYIVDVKKLRFEKTILGGIRTDDIIESIEHYISIGQYSTESIAFKYSAAIVSYFEHCISRGYFKNNDFKSEISVSRLDKESYYGKINEFIKGCSSLREKESIIACDSVEIDILVDEIDVFFEKLEKHFDKFDRETMSAMLGIKLMLLTGVKYNVLISLLLNDVDLKSSLININSFSIRLPVKFRDQLESYLLIKDSYVEKSDYLFVDHSGKRWGATTTSSKIPDVLSRCIGRTDTTGLVKFGLTNLLKGGMGIKDIEKLTTAKGELLRDCIPFSEEFEMRMKDKYVNMCLASMDIYYRL